VKLHALKLLAHLLTPPVGSGFLVIAAEDA